MREAAKIVLRGRIEGETRRVTTAQAFWIAAPGRGEIRDEALPEPGADEVVVRALYSGISRGTEAIVFNGRVPVSEYQRMRAPHQAGDFPAPVKYGYSSVGTVEQGPPELRGRRVFVLYPHQTRFVVPATALYPVPDDVPSERAILAANLETAINIVWDGHPRIGDRVGVIGAGTVGCLVAWLLSHVVGCQVQLVDVNPRRADVARAMGATFALPGSAAGDADLIVHASGSPAGLDLALGLAAFEATIVEASWYGADIVPVALGQAFHVKRLTIRSSQVGHLPLAQQARWDYRRRMQLAMRLLADPALDALITGENRFDSLPELMARLAHAPADTLCHRIRY
jgi:2-desacetyl-2-hydroxyethyl bacteriochlorophyllide A dehydrogenase